MQRIRPAREVTVTLIASRQLRFMVPLVLYLNCLRRPRLRIRVGGLRGLDI